MNTYYTKYTNSAIYTPVVYDRLFKGLDLDRYRVMQIVPVTLKSAAIIMQGKENDPTPYCLQYGGSGRYFKTLDGLKDYYLKRFKQPLNIAA